MMSTRPAMELEEEVVTMRLLTRGKSYAKGVYGIDLPKVPKNFHFRLLKQLLKCYFAALRDTRGLTLTSLIFWDQMHRDVCTRYYGNQFQSVLEDNWGADGPR